MPPPVQPAPLRLVVDDRESRSGLADALAARWPAVAVGRLSVGDVEVGPRVLVERKTVADFVLSIEDGRLLTQAWAMTRACEAPLLVVEGEDAFDAARIPPRALRGVVLTLLLRCRVPMLRTASVEETADVVAHVAAQEERRLARLAEPPAPKAGRAAMDVLASIPGIGDLRARRLLDTFGSVRAVLTADDDALLDVPEVGHATVRALRRTVDGVREVAPAYHAA